MKRSYQLVVLLELVAIALIGFKIYGNRQIASVAFIPKESVIASAESELEHYYEPNPGESYVVFRPDWLSYVPKITINGDTLNERFDYEPEKPQGVFRIITLGDSWTYGMFVSTEDNYSEVLEDKLNSELRCGGIQKFEVINLGVPSYDIRYEVERLRLRGLKYEPDLAVWHLIENDFQEINEFLKPRTKEYSEGISEKNYELEFGIWQRAVSDQLEEFGGEGIFRYQEKAFNKISEYYQGPLVIYVLPHESKIEERYRPIIEDFVSFNDNARFYGSELRLKPANVLPDYHPSAAGHSLIAEDLFGYLTANFLTQENCR